MPTSSAPREALRRLLALPAVDDLAAFLHGDTILASTIDTPFGQTQTVYADHVASGRPLLSVEQALLQRVLPLYANTHTDSSHLGMATNSLRESARLFIKEACGASADDFACVFVGSGSTAAIDLLAKTLIAPSFPRDSASSSPCSSHGCSSTSLPTVDDEPKPVPVTVAASKPSKFMFKRLLLGSFKQLRIMAKSRKAEATKIRNATKASATAPIPASAFVSAAVPVPKHRPVEKLPPLVIVSSCEHHSNLLVWRECGAEVKVVGAIPETGLIDLVQLETLLKIHAGTRCIYGSFSAASNIVAVVQPIKAISRLMHQYQGLAFFDYACAGPYVEIDMKNGSEDPMDWIDASFHSPHKFPGGPQAVGILLARRSLLAHGPLAVVGGGVVRWVDAQDHAYVQDAEQRHEAGTPAIVGSIRAGMAFYIKSLLSHQGQLAHRLQQLAMTGLQRLASMPDVIVLGPSAVYEHINSPLEEAWLGGPPRGWKLPVFSVQFRVLHPAARGRLLHHHLASRLLSDVFGIQARSGCACAGPYFQELTNMSVSQVREMVGMVEMGHEAAKMGFLRFSLSATHTAAELEYIFQAIEWVSRRGFLLTGCYFLDECRACWHPRRALATLALGTSASSNHLSASSRIAVAERVIAHLKGLESMELPLDAQERFAPAFQDPATRELWEQTDRWYIASRDIREWQADQRQQLRHGALPKIRAHLLG